ncbi:OB-fold domain-containing protein [Actinoplanes sp. NPDC051851]|uniref:OB-fold nucleic acid binding domain-containing protein n=1 Tax=Actinoplanes sp. NPDC051851 TaxID=3154753 RepID=UPI00341C46C4
MDVDSLTAPMTISFDYTRSLGPVLSRFMSGLRARRVLGARTSDGRVHVPPLEYDPVTHEPVTDLVEVAPVGTVVSGTTGWALVRLDGADTALLHRAAAGVSTGVRVRIRWAAVRRGHITDIEGFEPGDVSGTSGVPQAPSEDVTGIVTPITLEYTHTTSPGEGRYLRALQEGRITGRRCPVCRKVYVPPRICPVDGVHTEEIVEVADHGTITTFCVVNVPFAGQRLTPPYVVAQVLLDGADIPIPHLVTGIDAAEVRMGMRVAASWRDPAEWSTTPENIAHFEPSGEPDAPYETYAEHL